MDINIDANSSDQILITGAAHLGGTLDLTLAGGADNFIPLVSLYQIMTWTNGVFGDFNFFDNLIFNHGTETFAKIFVDHGDGHGELDLVVVGLTATPEPTTLAMVFGASLLGAGAAWRKRRRNAKGIQ
jgi:hypothetical protein